MTLPPIEPRLADVDPGDEVSLLLSDARTRAQAIIDESIERAQELLRGEPAPQAFERLRRTVNDMAVDVRAIHSRLDEIEALIRGGVAYRTPAAPPPPPAPPAYMVPPGYAPAPVYYAPAPTPAAPVPTYAPPSEAPAPPPPPAPPVYEAPAAPPPAPELPAYVPPVQVAPAPPPPPPTAPVPAAPVAAEPVMPPAPVPVQPAPVAPAPVPERSEAPPASAIPPQRPAPPEPVAPPPPPPVAPPAPRAEEPVAPPPPPMAAAPAPVPTPAPAPQAPAPATDAEATSNEGFDPDGGSIALRVSPVAGFQGLMRVQDALGRCRGVREAGVEAYAQGEARLRLHLSDRLSGEQLAKALGEILGRGARVASESISERSIQLTLE